MLKFTAIYVLGCRTKYLKQTNKQTDKKKTLLLPDFSRSFVSENFGRNNSALRLKPVPIYNLSRGVWCHYVKVKVVLFHGHHPKDCSVIVSMTTDAKFSFRMTYGNTYDVWDLHFHLCILMSDCKLYIVCPI